MKANKFMRIALIVVLCMAMLFTTACNPQSDTTPDSTPASTPAATPSTDVPTEEGKVTYYFTMSADSAAVPAHAAIFITGGAWQWGTGAGSEMFTNLEGTNIYYLITDKTPATEGATAGQENHYQLVVGLTQASGAATWGLQWNDNYKSAECAAIGYPDNPTFTWNEGDNKVDLGTHTFAMMPPAPVAVKTTLKVSFAAALPEGARVLVIGSLNSWNGEEMTSTDGITWTLDVEMLANSYEYKIKVFEKDTLADDFSNKWDVGTECGDYSAGNAVFELKESHQLLGELYLMKNLEYAPAA